MSVRVVWIGVGLLLLVLALSTGGALYYRLFLGLLAVPALGFLASVLSARRRRGRRATAHSLPAGRRRPGGAHRPAEHPLVAEAAAGRCSTTQSRSDAPDALRPSGHTARRPGRPRAIASAGAVYTFGELEITSRDPFGLFRRTMRSWASPRPRSSTPRPSTCRGFFVLSGRGWTEGIVRGPHFHPQRHRRGRARVHLPRRREQGALARYRPRRQAHGEGVRPRTVRGRPTPSGWCSTSTSACRRERAPRARWSTP